MIFLTEDDLKSQIFEVLMRESKNDFADVLDLIESQEIGVMKSFLAARYDTDYIFSQTGLARDPLIIKMLVILVLYLLIRRNAARKVPSNYKADYDMAIKWLEGVKAGGITPPDLPGNILLTSLYHGSSRNEDWHDF